MTPLYLAVNNESAEVIKLLLSNDKIDINATSVLF